MKLAAATLAVCSLWLADPLLAATARSPASAARPSPHKPAAPALGRATPEQIAASERVFYGHYECEFQQSLDIDPNAQNHGYVDVRHGKVRYVTRPVLSSTGAVRLEDVKGQVLLVQIPVKSFLLDVKAGRRLVDDCVSPRQREAVDEISRIKAAEAAASAASAAASATVR
jgi:hypothetical protein